MINLKKILCPVDLSEPSMLALMLAQAVAARYKAHLTIIHVLENPYLDIPGGNTGVFSFKEIMGLYCEERREHILDVLRREGAPAVEVDTEFEEGVPCDEIIKIARETKSDMIVMSTSTGGPYEMLAGHTTECVVRTAPCPVLSVRTDVSAKQREKLEHMRDLMEKRPEHKKTILLPTDFSEHSALATNYAISLAKEYEAEIIVLHVMERVAEFTSMMGGDLPGYDTVLDYYGDLLKTAQKLVEEICSRAKKHDVKADGRVISGKPSHDILDVAGSEPIDLIVMGTHGRRGFSRVVHGSVAEAVVRHAPCSVLSVKRPEHDFINPE